VARSALHRLDYLAVDNVDQLWERLKARVRIVYPIETMEYGVRGFGLLDDNGYQLFFAQHVAIYEEDFLGFSWRPKVPTPLL
jgi:hypothetical protein